MLPALLQSKQVSQILAGSIEQGILRGSSNMTSLLMLNYVSLVD
jgi:hypothetical protein